MSLQAFFFLDGRTKTPLLVWSPSWVWVCCASTTSLPAEQHTENPSVCIPAFPRSSHFLHQPALGHVRVQEFEKKFKKATKEIIGAVPVLEQECCDATPLELDKEGWGCEKLSRHCDTTAGSLSFSQGLPNLDLVVFWLQTRAISVYLDSLTISGLQWGDYALLLHSSHKIFHSGYFLPAWEVINSFCLHNFYLCLVILYIQISLKARKVTILHYVQS